MRVLRGNDIVINWTIRRDIDGNLVDEDFSSSVLLVFFVDAYGKRKVNYTVDKSVITFTISGDMQRLGSIYLDAQWQDKNSRAWSRARLNEVVEFVDNPDFVDYGNIKDDVEISTFRFLSEASFGATSEGGSTTLGGLTNVSYSADSAEDGSILVSEGNEWVPKTEMFLPTTKIKGKDINTVDDLIDYIELNGNTISTLGELTNVEPSVDSADVNSILSINDVGMWEAKSDIFIPTGVTVDDVNIKTFDDLIDYIWKVGGKTFNNISRLSISPSSAYKGDGAISVQLSWEYVKAVTSQSINGISLAIASRAYTEIVTKDTTFKLNCTYDGKSEEKSISISFKSPIYYGTNINKFSKTSNTRITINVRTSEYALILINRDTVRFSVNGFVGGFKQIESKIVNNEQYYLYQSTYPSLGLINIDIL